MSESALDRPGVVPLVGEAFRIAVLVCRFAQSGVAGRPRLGPLLLPPTTGAATTSPMATTSALPPAPQISFAPGAPSSSTTSTTSSTSSTLSPPTTTCAAASTSNSSSAAAAVAVDAVRNQALNSIGNTGHGTASTGSAVSTSAETMIPLSAVTHGGAGIIPLAVNHQGG
jgi:hypothetical protein